MNEPNLECRWISDMAKRSRHLFLLPFHPAPRTPGCSPPPCPGEWSRSCGRWWPWWRGRAGRPAAAAEPWHHRHCPRCRLSMIYCQHREGHYRMTMNSINMLSISADEDSPARMFARCPRLDHVVSVEVTDSPPSPPIPDKWAIKVNGRRRP